LVSGVKASCALLVVAAQVQQQPANTDHPLQRWAPAAVQCLPSLLLPAHANTLIAAVSLRSCCGAVGPHQAVVERALPGVPAPGRAPAAAACGIPSL
jgi:hypothetical protein